MQFIVFAAFAMVLSVPPDGPPWKTVPGDAVALGSAIGQSLIAAAVAWWYARSVHRRLDRDPARLSMAQHTLASANQTLRIVLLAGFSAGLFLTDWTRFLRRWPAMDRVPGLDEMLMLAPFLVATLIGWVVLYRADKAIRDSSFEARLWAAQPARPTWSLGHYLLFMFRHNVLIILVPMLPILLANDLVGESHFGPRLRRLTNVPWADQAALGLVAGAVFLVAPLMLRFVWHTRPLPVGELRGRLETLCRRIGLAYRDILIWESDGMMVNAAVMGLVRPVRYILLSDGLLESMDDRSIEAVFGHEAGHVRHHHITFYLLFAVLSMLIVGGVSEVALRQWPELFRRSGAAHDYLQVGAMILIVLVWGVGFGLVSKRFEWQADLFGARSITPEPSACDRPCVLHHTFDAPGQTATASRLAGEPLCATAAAVFGDALQRIAELNGIPVEARSWRHSSIGNRIRLLRRYAREPQALVGLGRQVITVKLILALGTTVGVVIAAWLYWPAKLLAKLGW